VFIDEFQFFNADKDALQFLKHMDQLGINVTIAGLSLNWKRQMFPIVAECYGMFTIIEQRYALCSRCGEQAMFTAKLDQTNTKLLQVGDKEYESRCHACF